MTRGISRTALCSMMPMTLLEHVELLQFSVSLWKVIKVEELKSGASKAIPLLSEGYSQYHDKIYST